MKRFLSILMLATFAFAFVSCGDDDDNTTLLSETADSHTYSFSILSSAGADFAIPMTMNFDDFSKLAGKEGSIKSAEATTEAFMKISGVEKGEYTLEGLTLKVKGTNITHPFGRVTQDKTYNGIDTDLTFLNKVAKRLAEKKEIEMVLSGKSDKKVNENVKVQINLAILVNKGIE